MTIRSAVACSCALFLPAPAAFAFDADQSNEAHWPQWRGPALNGVSSATNLPVEWSADSNIVWKTALPAWAGSTPVIWGDRIFLTSASAAPAPEQPADNQSGGDQSARSSTAADELTNIIVTSLQDAPPQPEGDRPRRRPGSGGGGGRRGDGRNPGGQQILLFCISRTTGDILWQHHIDDGNQLHMKGNHASPSCVTDGQHVWALTGNGTVIALDMDGRMVWSNNLQNDHGPFGLNWGYASSPLLFDGMVIIEVLHGHRTDDPSYIVALDALTGQQKWKQERPTDAPAESPDAYTTPIIAHVGGQPHIVISGGDYVTGHDPANGKELWRVGGTNPQKAGNYRVVASPVSVGDMLYAPTRVRPLLAIQLNDSAPPALPNDASVIWRWDDRGGPDVPTPACDGERFYMVSDNGMATCLDARTGAVIWGPERTAQGNVSSSPILADGKLYFTTEDTITVVLDATGDQFKLLATNELDGTYTLSSPATAGSNLFIRTGSHLYCIGAAPAD
jgi:outer membrane protein assembly factor BamB